MNHQLHRRLDQAARPDELVVPRNISAPRNEEAGPNLLLEYFQSVVRHRLLIISLATAGVLASALLHSRTQPVYQTRTSLDIQSLNSDFMNMRSVDPTAGSPSDTAIQTQIKLLESDSLMDRVQARITSEQHPAFIARTDLLSRFERAIHIGRPVAIPYQQLLDETANGVKVKPLGITQLIEITCNSWDPTFAARFCNTLTSEFQTEDLESRGDQAKRTSDWLMHQAQDIRQKAEESQQRLIAATGGNGLILAQATDTVGEDGLRQMQGELVKAEADRMEKEAEVSTAQGASGDALPTNASNPAYAASAAKLADLENQVAALVPPLTEANPRIIHLRSEIAQVKAGMAQENVSSNNRLRNELASARHREHLLQVTYQGLEAKVSSDLQKGSEVDLLRREVQSEQQLYQTLLQRAKEAGFASAMQATTIRVVDPARERGLAIYPQGLAAAAVGLILGTLCGLILALFKDRNSKVLRVPGESERLLNLEELGVIPSPRALRKQVRQRTVSGKTLLTIGNASPVSERTAAWSEDFSLVAEAYRNATFSIMLADKVHRARTYVICSPNAGEGKTTIISNLGIALSKSKLRVVLVDGDLRKPTLHTVLGVSNDKGLRNILRGEAYFNKLSIGEYCQRTAFPGLSVIPSGSGKEPVGDLLHSTNFTELLEQLSLSSDVILIDTPPMLHMSDARVFAGQTNGAILIVRSGVTTRSQALDARLLLDRDEVHIIGSILNDFNPGREGKYGYYRSYYAYQQSSEKRTAVEA